MNKKGFSVLGLIITLLIVALVAVTVYYFIYKHGKGRGNDGTMSAVEAMVPIESKHKGLEYIEVTVKGNTYIYDGNEIELEEIKRVIDDHESLSCVMLKDDNASEKAYRTITDYLNQNHIQITNKGENVQ